MMVQTALNLYHRCYKWRLTCYASQFVLSPYISNSPYFTVYNTLSFIYMPVIPVSVFNRIYDIIKVILLHLNIVSQIRYCYYLLAFFSWSLSFALLCCEHRELKQYAAVHLYKVSWCVYLWPYWSLFSWYQQSVYLFLFNKAYF